MSWFKKIAFSDRIRLERNIKRLKELQSKVHDLATFVISSQGGGYQVLIKLLDDNLVHGRPAVHKKLKEALISENNQKMALDSPNRFQAIMYEAENIIGNEILIEQRKFNELGE